MLSECCLAHRHQTPVVKHRAVKTRLNAFQYDVINPPEPSSKPFAILKRRLYEVFPILRNEELVSRIAWTLMVIAIARLGQQLKLPYVDANIAPQSGTACRLLRTAPSHFVSRVCVPCTCRILLYVLCPVHPNMNKQSMQVFVALFMLSHSKQTSAAATVS